MVLGAKTPRADAPGRRDHRLRSGCPLEDAETLDELRRLQCDEVQGYLIGPPMTASDFADWLQQGGHDRPPDAASAAD